MAIIPIFIILAIFTVGIGGTILWVWMLIDCATNEPAEGNEKIIWILILIFTHLLGSLLYLMIRRPERIKLYGK